MNLQLVDTFWDNSSAWSIYAQRLLHKRPSYGTSNSPLVVRSLPAPAQPAGASRGQGVRVAWTLAQILCAQKTMGGRVAQKYVETPLLLPRNPLNPRRLSNGSAFLGPDTHRRRRLRLRRGSTHGWHTKCEEEQKSGAHSPDTCDPGESCWDRSNAVEQEPTISGGETGSPSGRSEEGTHSHAGDTEHMDIGPVGSAGERKFDIRSWVLVTAWDPLEAFVFDEGYLRVCPQDFTLDESKFAEPQVHLTNLSARRPNKRTTKAWGGQCQGRDGEQRRRRSSSAAASRGINRDKEGAREHTDTATSEAETAGFVASQAELIQRLGEMDNAGDSGGAEGLEGGGEVRARGERIWRSKVSPSIERVVRETLLAARPHMRPRSPSFQLFGFDLLVDRQLRPCESQAFEPREPSQTEA